MCGYACAWAGLGAHVSIMDTRMCVCGRECAHEHISQPGCQGLGAAHLVFLKQGRSLAKNSLNRQALGIQPPPPSTGTTNSPHNTQHPDFCTLMTELLPSPKGYTFYM